ncbi:hypothetical protein A5882_003476 [Enterococcus sp. 4E1_DIV0656]|nr:hypothetical protein A5882_003476 [Enterococcus sp. 4E1_DIV0656]
MLTMALNLKQIHDPEKLTNESKWYPGVRIHTSERVWYRQFFLEDYLSEDGYFPKLNSVHKDGSTSLPTYSLEGASPIRKDVPIQCGDFLIIGHTLEGICMYSMRQDLFYETFTTSGELPLEDFVPIFHSGVYNNILYSASHAS